MFTFVSLLEFNTIPKDENIHNVNFNLFGGKREHAQHNCPWEHCGDGVCPYIVPFLSLHLSLSFS